MMKRSFALVPSSPDQRGVSTPSSAVLNEGSKVSPISKWDLMTAGFGVELDDALLLGDERRVGRHRQDASALEPALRCRRRRVDQRCPGAGILVEMSESLPRPCLATKEVLERAPLRSDRLGACHLIGLAAGEALAVGDVARTVELEQSSVRLPGRPGGAWRLFQRDFMVMAPASGWSNG
jgi:hypothetical protein